MLLGGPQAERDTGERRSEAVVQLASHRAPLLVTGVGDPGPRFAQLPGSRDELHDDPDHRGEVVERVGRRPVEQFAAPAGHDEPTDRVATDDQRPVTRSSHG